MQVELKCSGPVRTVRVVFAGWIVTCSLALAAAGRSILTGRGYPLAFVLAIAAVALFVSACWCALRARARLVLCAASLPGTIHDSEEFVIAALAARAFMKLPVETSDSFVRAIERLASDEEYDPPRSLLDRLCPLLRSANTFPGGEQMLLAIVSLIERSRDPKRAPWVAALASGRGRTSDSVKRAALRCESALTTAKSDHFQ